MDPNFVYRIDVSIYLQPTRSGKAPPVYGIYAQTPESILQRRPPFADKVSMVTFPDQPDGIYFRLPTQWHS